MKILVVGSGGREHALAWKLRQSPEVEQVYCAPGNAGTAQLGENVPIPTNDLSGLLKFATENRIGLTVIGPDDALAAGMADLFIKAGLRVFGPTKAAARLESSKIFAKEMMRRFHIPTAMAGSFEESAKAIHFCKRLQYPLVIKADGLALGKGVVIAQNREEAVATIEAMMDQGQFGDAGRRIVVEEYLTGVECSIHALVGGGSYKLLAAARDHKRAFDGDQGPNTGGMGAVSPSELCGEENHKFIESEILAPFIRGIAQTGLDFRGLLFPGLMMTPQGPRILEFNCRFGDPETQTILPRLKSDLLPLLEATIDGHLDDVKIDWDERASVTVIMASGGYPGKYEVDKPIRGLDAGSALPDVQIFHAGTRRAGDDIVTAGGRVLAVNALGASVEEARERVYAAVSRIEFEGAFYRHDIAVPPVGAKVAAH
ncbi:MAG: phosphoribosylamine--glycine ligase [Chthoniobacterales bacterium]